MELSRNEKDIACEIIVEGRNSLLAKSAIENKNNVKKKIEQDEIIGRIAATQIEEILRKFA